MTAGPARTPPDAPRGGGAGRLHTWRAAVRIARRDALRAKGRSAMVLAMIALPIVAVSAADITIRSSSLSTAQSVTRTIGAADVRLTGGYYGGAPFYQSPDAEQSAAVKDSQSAADSTPASLAAADAALRAAIPPGERAITEQRTYALIRTKYGVLDAVVREIRTDDPIAAGLTRLLRGRRPAGPGEMMATGHFLKSSGLHLGSRLRASTFDPSYRIVGVYEEPDSLKDDQLIARPGAFIGPYLISRQRTDRDDGGALATVGRGSAALVLSGNSPLDYLVSAPGGFGWDQVLRANAHGVMAYSRQVQLHPPARADVPLYTKSGYSFGPGQSGSDRAEALAAGATIAGLAMLEICLLAGPAFAVGARRSRRQLGLVGANGGDRRHIRAIVLSGGLVLGAAAAVAGTALGVALTVALRGFLEDYVGKRFGGLVLRPAELLGIAALAVATGLLAALVPAVTASRQSVLSSLTGRRGVRHASRVLPVIGLGAVCLGGGIAVFGSARSDSPVVVGVGSGIAELGVVALTPILVGLFGRLGRLLPLSPRLALRDAVRNRGRTAPAVAAVLAAVAGTVAVATFAASQARQDRDTYEARAPRGVYAVSSGSGQRGDLDAVRSAVAKHFPVTGRADVGRPVFGAKTCDLYSTAPGCGDVQPVMPDSTRCPAQTDSGETAELTLAQRRALAHDWRCSGRSTVPPAIQTSTNLVTGGPAVLHALGIRDGAAEQALARGETVLFDRSYLDRGRLALQLVPDAGRLAASTVPEGRTDPAAGRVVRVPVHFAPGDRAYGLLAVMPAKAAAAAGIRSVPAGSYFTTSRMPTGAERQGLDYDLAKLDTNPEVYLESGYHPGSNLVLLALTVFAGLVTIGAAAIATGLAQADAEPDLRTLAAIGAAPGVRRRLAGLQCGVVAAMGVLLGTAAGVLPAAGLRAAERRREWSYYHRAIDSGFGFGQVPHVPLSFPWGTFAILIVAVPLGATLLAAAFTRSRERLGRRAEA